MLIKTLRIIASPVDSFLLAGDFSEADAVFGFRRRDGLHFIHRITGAGSSKWVSYGCKPLSLKGEFWGWEAGIRAHSQRAEGELRCAREPGRPATSEALSSEWLGGRDSNPDNGVQSAVSYR
jgi:hypothetical protein